MENKKIVAFDYDGTLSIPSIEEYAKLLIEKGIEVWIVTSRYDSLEKYTPKYLRDLGMTILEGKDEYNNLFVVAERLGIPEEHIVFTNMELKWTYFINHPEFIWHLDDLWSETLEINERTKVKGIHWTGNTNWRVECSKLLWDNYEEN